MLTALAALTASAAPADADNHESAAAPAIEPRTTPERELSDDIRYKLIGYIRLETAFVRDDPDVEFVGRNDGFRLQNARIGVDGTWRDRVRVRLSADGAIDERDNANEVEGTLRFALKDAFVDLELAPALVVRIARFKIYFDIEELTSPSRRGFIDPALSSRGVRATEGFEEPGLAVRRNLGVALRSERLVDTGQLVLGYEVAAQNGNGERDAANDNDSLAYSAALFATIADAVSVFGAGRYNRRTELMLPFARTEDDFEAAAGARLSMAPVRGTAQVLYRRTDFPTTGGEHANAFGVHAEALVTIPGVEALEAGYRFSLLEPTDLMAGNRVIEHTAGINVSLPRLRSMLQVNATHTVEQAGFELTNDRVEALFQLSL